MIEFKYRKLIVKNQNCASEMVSFEIIFENNPHKVIYAGQLLRGNAILTLTEAKTIRGVYIRIKGNAYCSWEEGVGDSKETFTNREIYLNEKTYLFGDSFGIKQKQFSTNFFSIDRFER